MQHSANGLLSSERKTAVDLPWLRETVADLLRDAKAGSEPDHTACVKYAELLFEILKGQPAPAGADGGALDAARRAAWNKLTMKPACCDL